MKKTQTNRRKTIISQPKDSNKTQSSSSGTRLVASGSQRKASTPTHDKPTRTESPDVSRIVPTEISAIGTGNQAAVGKPATVPTSAPASKPATGSDEISLEDEIHFEYTRYLQTIYRRQLAEAGASEVDDKLTALQKRIAENQNILQKTTERLKNIQFNKEVDSLHQMKNPNYGRVLEKLENANCKEYLEAVKRKLEESQNRLAMKHIELPEGAGTELMQVMKDTLAACEKLKTDNNLEVPKIIAEVKASNDSTSDTLSRCLEMEPAVENLMLERATLEINAKYDD